MKRLLTLGLIAACNTPAPSLHLQLAGPTVQECPSTDCAQVQMTCASYMSIRIIDPSDPAAPFLSQCTEIPPNRNKDMCSLNSVDLDQTPLPIRELEVRVAIYPASALPLDPMTGQPICPADVEYDAARGFPVEKPDSPALGGRAFYHPGDQDVMVTLGCTNLDLVNQLSCVGTSTVHVAATVEDFDSHVSVSGSPGLADRLAVSVGEPTEIGGVFLLNPGDARRLDLTVPGPAPAWGADVDLEFAHYACLEVLEDGPSSTTSLTCRDTGVAGVPSFTLSGTRLSRVTLQQILTALSMTLVPDQGLTVGVLLDSRDIPIPNATVAASSGTVRYLSADRTNFSGTTTASSGLFVSTDAPFGTTFSTTGLIQPYSRPGGLVQNKVTMIVLRPTLPEPNPM